MELFGGKTPLRCVMRPLDWCSYLDSGEMELNQNGKCIKTVVGVMIDRDVGGFDCGDHAWRLFLSGSDQI